NKSGRGNLVAKVDSWPACHEFEPVPLKTRNAGRAMHEKSIYSQTFSRCCGVEVRRGGASSAARGLLATYLATLNHGQGMKMTSELAPPFPSCHTNSRLSTDLTCTAPYTVGLWWYGARTHDMPAMTRHLAHWATAAPL
ncbi:hypothetical protein TNCV_3370211, partial [Trichonephila clavipes]